MVLHPIEYRYFTEEMKEIFSQAHKFEMWLKVEAALSQAHAEFGTIPKSAADEISEKASLKYVKIERIHQIENEIDHDLMAMVRALSEACKGDAGRYVHLSATSYDIEDTANALILTQASNLILQKLLLNLEELKTKCQKNKKLVCVGRTHGQHALPTTYGMRFGVWAAEFCRHIDRMRELLPRISVGKMSGAVGTMASYGELGVPIQNKVMELLDLKPVLIANQILQRDRYAELILILALIAGTVDKIARQIRILQRNEIAELYEPFKKKQVGSSTMPQKRNPHKSERLCGLSRVIKSNTYIALENMTLEDERDLTNSASERVLFPETFVLLDYMLKELHTILSGLEFNKENITKNLYLTEGAILTERLMLELVNKGIGRQEAHEILRTVAIQARTEKKSIRDLLKLHPIFSNKFSPTELDELLDPKNYIGKAVEQVENLIQVIQSKYFDRSQGNKS
ncbi:MAG: adenylosuccinate lyase [Candidatus Lokiarchaeota archaeon]|nr:adenylosuccinate lyase [Candidatus Lokiarchaeota archaeon]